MTEDTVNQEVKVVTTTITPANTIQEDIAKIEAAIANLQAAGADLFSDEITALQDKLGKVKAEAEDLIVEVQIVEASFVREYGQALAHGIEIALLGVIAGRLVGLL